MRWFFFLFVLLVMASVTAAFGATTTPQVPTGTVAASENPLGGVEEFYLTALALGGLLAFGAIVYAAIEYALARGNPGMQSDAREGITQAILGLLLLIGAFLMLRTINPELLTPSLPPAESTEGPVPSRCPPGISGCSY